MRACFETFIAASRGRGAGALVGALAVLSATAPAEAYSFKTSASGAPVRWSVPTLEIVIDPSLREIDPAAVDVVNAAFGTWESTGVGLPALTLREGAADPVGYRPGDTNHSTVRYDRGGNPLAGEALAVTVLTFDDEGTILDADVIVNGGEGRSFGVLVEASPEIEDEELVAYDLQNVATHEIGHLFGLGEELVDEDATMFVRSARGEIKKRTLDRDDVAGIGVLYAGGCSCTLPGTTPAEGALFTLAALAVAGVSARRRRTAAPG
jgi:MYXO-CTERM domain-containing protein